MEKKNVKNENVTKEELKEIELQPTWSKLKSFHQKAMVGTTKTGDKYLKSFGFLVCEIIKGEVKIHNEIDKWDSKSTIRHINNFLYENGFETGNTKELTEMYILKIKKTTKTEENEESKKVKKEIKIVDDEKSKIKKFENPKNEKKAKEDLQVEKTTKKLKNEKIENQEKIVEVGA